MSAALSYQLDLDLPGDGFATDFAATTIVLACRNANIDAPIAGVTPAIDPERVRHDMLHARALGFGAKMCIHPSQVAVVREAFRPDAQVLAWATRVVDAWQAAATPGAIQVDGRMVDKPVVLKAQRILSCAEFTA